MVDDHGQAKVLKLIAQVKKGLTGKNLSEVRPKFDDFEIWHTLPPSSVDVGCFGDSVLFPAARHRQGL